MSDTISHPFTVPNSATTVFAAPGKSWSKAETTTLELITQGPFENLANTYQQGGSITIGSVTYRIRNVTVTHEEGGMGTARISTVAPDSGGVISTTLDIDMQEVQMSIKRHPKVLAATGALEEIEMWEKTPEGVRIYSDSGAVKYRYYRTTASDPEGVLTDVSVDMAKNCIAAMCAGIETYNVYLPVVERTTTRISIEGSEYSGDIGKFSDLPSGITFPTGSYDLGRFFKSRDKWSRSADGLWTRNEQWTYSPDSTHDWIYSKT